MAKKKKALPKNLKVTLRTKSDQQKTQDFEIPVALKLLRLPNSAWDIKDDNYIFSGNDIKRRPSEGNNTKPEE
jgi:hypothetical protein